MKKLSKSKLIITSAIVIVVLVADLTFTGFLKFGYNVVRCGRVPVKVSLWGSDAWYDTPGNYTPGGARTTYLCTSAEAEARNLPLGLNSRSYDHSKSLCDQLPSNARESCE